MQDSQKHQIARCQLALGSLRLAQGDPRGASASFDAAAALADAGDRRFAALFAFGHGLLAQKRGDSEAAIKRLELAVASFREVGDAAGEALALRALSPTLREAGHDTEAEVAEADAQRLLAPFGKQSEDAARSLLMLALAGKGSPGA